MNYSEVVITLDELLKEKGRTRYWLSKQTGITEVQLMRIAKQQTESIKKETLAAICDVLDCQPADLIKLIPKK